MTFVYSLIAFAVVVVAFGVWYDRKHRNHMRGRTDAGTITPAPRPRSSGPGSNDG